MKEKSALYKGILAFKLENTNYVTHFIKKHQQLEKRCINGGKHNISKICFRYAHNNNDMFGNRLILELYDVFWDRVWYDIRKQK